VPLIKEIDFGTPRSKAESMVTLTIDGFEVTVPEGTSIMRAAMEAGIEVPKLCATDSLEAFGSCRLCLVEIEAAPAHPPPARPRSRRTSWSRPRASALRGCGAG
jgi:formate dehydrogenase major subunit